MNYNQSGQTNPKTIIGIDYSLTSPAICITTDFVFKNSKFYLGHDEPQYDIENSFLLKKEVWCHAKNLEALIEMKKIGSHYFWHENDQFTLTSKGYIWTYPGNKLSHNSI